MKLDFPDEFFREEVRDDFTIPAEMKHAWAAELEVLAQLDDICKEYNLHYFALYGTLLGAVRDKGFIPWDDDMDIGMLRGDLLKLERIAPDVFPREMHMVSYQSLKGFNTVLPRVTNGLREFPKDIQTRIKKYRCPYIVGVDIFPFDYVPPTEEERELQKQLLFLLEYCEELVKAEDTPISLLRYNIVQVEETFNVTIDERKPKEEIVNQLVLLEDAVCAMYGPDDSDEVAISFLQQNWDRRFKAELFTNTIMQPFEFTELPIPVGYKEFLTAYYGDYMTKINIPSSHDYPFYKPQKEILDNMGIKINYN